MLRAATWFPQESWLRAVLVLVGLIGMAGNVAYGFDTIHMSLGDAQLVDRPGAANLIKLLGLFFPLSMAIVALVVAFGSVVWSSNATGEAISAGRTSQARQPRSAR